MRQCKEPEPYNPGSCERWTLLDPSNVANQDCDDLNATVYPGAVNDEEGSEGYWDVPYCVNTGTQASGTWSSGWDCGPAAVSFDYDCSGGEDRSIASTKTNATCQKECQMCGFCDSSCQGGGGCTTCTQWGCSSSGWSGALPACGETAQWKSCVCGDACSPLCLGCDGVCNSSNSWREVRCR